MFFVWFLIIVKTCVNASPHTGRIHGGVDAPLGFATHMVALISGDRPSVVCGGSIVSETFVLTAAHCITPQIHLGELVKSFHGRVGSNIWHTGGLLVFFEYHFVHPAWDEDTIKYDVGLLSLTKSLVFDQFVGKIGLNFAWVPGGEDMFVTGWGTTEWRIIGDAVHLAPTPDNLQLLEVKTVTISECAHSIASSSEWSTVSPPLQDELEICAFHSFGHGMCNGDSGSALVSMSDGSQAGIVSWGFPCARGLPDVFTRLYGVKEFILEVFKQRNK